VDEFCGDKKTIVESISLSRNINGRRIEALSNDIELTIKDMV